MKLVVERNAPGIEQTYLEGLSSCFPGAWNEASYRWYLGRPFRNRHPDKLTVHDGGQLAAGMGINYRRLRSPGGHVHDVGVLTAAWTLPHYRRRGCFARLVERAVRVGTESGCAALVSFARTDSTSARCLRRFGIREVRTHYLSVAPGEPLRRTARHPPVRAWHDKAGRAAKPGAVDALAFHYETTDEWAAQFTHRSERTALLEVGSALAVVEQVRTTDRLQFLSHDAGIDAVVAIAERARNAGRPFFYFTTDRDLAEHAMAHGLRETAGTLMIVDLPNEAGARLAGVAPPDSMTWHVQPGDRM